MCILRYIKGALGKGLLYDGLVLLWIEDPRQNTALLSVETWCYVKAKKNDIFARSSVVVEYCAMALATCEHVWLK